jgi:hypothetical protein
MSESYGRASVRQFLGLSLCILGTAGLGCAAQNGADEPADPAVAVETSALGGGAGGGACSRKDTQDTTCNGVDDDCDGVLDEDCDFGPAQCPAGYNIIVGTYKNDVLTGTSRRDCILGYGGNDTIRGMSGDDVLVGGPGNDNIDGGSGNDVLNGGAGNDTLSGGSGKDNISGGDGDDKIDGGSDNDTIDAGNGNDKIDGGSGDDKIDGGNGDDKIDSGSGNDTIDGGNGDDAIDGGSGNDTIHGGACHDKIQGGSGKDNVYGDSGSDRLTCSDRKAVTDGGANTDACDGTSCELSSNSRACSRDRDCSHGKVCVRGAADVGICVPSAEITTTDATCDGVDDDCDGKVDENYAKVDTTCGSGSCHAAGKTSCVDGHVVDSCVPPPNCQCAATDTTCNGVDDDCDGDVDEDFASTSTSCGVGACASTGTNSCVNGSVVNNCTPGTPAANDATCDGVDNDCNGATDEGYVPAPTSCGVGACVRSGNTSCVNGSVVDSCTPGAPAASDATCNGVDDNCNGATDEGYVSAPTSCGVGACHSTGVKTCSGGSEHDSCAPGAPAASDATCDGVDDDCNGTNDEDYASASTSCGVGACQRSGTKSCVGSSVHDSCTPGTPAPSDATCDGVDDNCNGVNDEQYAASCSGTTLTSCVGGAEQQHDCDNHDVCDGDETCSVGACHDGTALVTDDGDACTTDTCHPLFGVHHTPVAENTSCSDGNTCNGDELCKSPAPAVSGGICTPVPADAVAWWPGDNSPKDVLNGLDGTLLNTTGYVASKVGPGFKLDGAANAIDLSAHAAELNLAGVATLEMWIRGADNNCRTLFHLRQDDDNQQYLQVGDGCTGDAANELFTWTRVVNGVPSVRVYATTGSDRTMLTAARYIHVALTFDGTNTLLYFNGQPRTMTQVVGSDTGSWGNFADATSATLGGSQPALAGASNFRNELDEVTLYDRALSQPEILGIVTATPSGAGGKCKPPVCTAGTNAPSGMSCEDDGTCDGAGMCMP